MTAALWMAACGGSESALLDSGAIDSSTGDSGAIDSSTGDSSTDAGAVAVDASEPRDPGRLTYVGRYTKILGIADNLGWPRAAAISPGSGTHLYVTASLQEAVNVFARNPATSELTWLQSLDRFNGLSLASNLVDVTVSLDGKNVYTAATEKSVVHQLSRDGSSGMVGFQAVYQHGTTKGGSNLRGAAAVAVSPDGDFVYVAAVFSHAVSIFSRDASTGDLSLVDALVDGQEGVVDGLEGATGLAFSPDGSNLYVAGANEDKVGVFSRNATSGSLTFLEVQEEGVEGVDGLDRVDVMAVSPDGKHLYAVGVDGTAIAIFSRASDGRLNFVEAVRDGQGGVADLGGTGAVAVSPDGNQVYVTANMDNALLTFDRNPTTGALTFVESHVDGVPPVDGLAGASALVVSPDGGSVYATTFQEAPTTVTAFRRD